MDAVENGNGADMPVAAATPPTRTPRSQKTPIQKEALEAAFKSKRPAADCQLGKLCADAFSHTGCIAEPFGIQYTYVSLCMRAVMQFPPEEVRRALGERIGLTEQQVQVI